MSYTEITYEIEQGVATITLNRPDQLNAWTPTMAREMRAAMGAANSDPAVRAIILTGAGRGFCSGFDMTVLGEISASGENASVAFDPVDPGAREDFQHPMTWLPSIGKPIIAAINGAAAGLGLALTLFCDLRFVSDKAVLVTSFSRRGLIAEHGTSWMLTRLVGHSRALDLMLSSRRVDAAEAYRIGLADRLIPAENLIGEAKAYARDIADNVSPRSTRIIKRQLWDALLVGLKDSMADADREMTVSLKTKDFREGVDHFIEKRQARFTGE